MDYFVWTEAEGPRSLHDLLATSGVDVSGWQNLAAEALSGNGNTIVGQGINPSGAPEGWAIRLQGNRAPVAAIGYSPDFPNKRKPISFWGTNSTDPDGDEIVDYLWDFGDGTTAAGPVVSHTYAQAGNYTVTLVVSDGRLNSVPASVVVAVFEQAPVANAGGPYSGAKNAAIRFDGTASSDADGDPLTYFWDFGDGTIGSGPSPAHAYARSGIYTATLVVSDGAASSTPARATVQLDGRASADPDGAIVTVVWRQVAGPAVTLSGGMTLAPSFEAPRVSGSGTATVLSFELTVTDDDGLSASDRVDVNVTRK
jgi:chitodextrinase